MVQCRWGSTWEHLQALRGGTHLHAVKPKPPCYQDWGLSASAGPAVFSCPSQKCSAQCKPNGFQLWLLQRYWNDKVIVLEFEHIQFGYEMKLQEVFLWLKISAQPGGIKEVKRLKCSIFKHWQSGLFPIKIAMNYRKRGIVTWHNIISFIY